MKTRPFRETAIALQAARLVLAGGDLPTFLAKLVKRIQSLEFIDLAKLLPDNIELMRRADSELIQGQRQLIN